MFLVYVDFLDLFLLFLLHDASFTCVLDWSFLAMCCLSSFKKCWGDSQRPRMKFFRKDLSLLLSDAWMYSQPGIPSANF